MLQDSLYLFNFETCTVTELFSDDRFHHVSPVGGFSCWFWFYWPVLSNQTAIGDFLLLNPHTADASLPPIPCFLKESHSSRSRLSVCIRFVACIFIPPLSYFPSCLLQKTHV